MDEAPPPLLPLLLERKKEPRLLHLRRMRMRRGARRWTRLQRRVSRWTLLPWVCLLRPCHRSPPACLLSRID
jgi:hypothetical protein